MIWLGTFLSCSVVSVSLRNALLSCNNLIFPESPFYVLLIYIDSVNFDKLPFIFFKYCGYYIFTCTVCFHLSASDIFRFLFLLLPMSRHDCCLLQCLVYKCFISLSGMSFSCHLQVFILLVACFIWLFSFRELTGLKCHIPTAHFLSLSVQWEQWIYRNMQTYIHAHMYPTVAFRERNLNLFLKNSFHTLQTPFRWNFFIDRHQTARQE